MKCPFRVKTFRNNEYLNGKAIGEKVSVRHCEFEDCHGDDCPFFYMDCHDVEKCARCDGGENYESL